MVACFATGQTVADYFEFALGELNEGCNGVVDIMSGGDPKTQMGLLTSKLAEVVSGQIMESLMVLAYSLAVLFFLIAMIQLVNQDRLTIEVFIKFFAKLVISIFCISITPTIYEYSLKFGDELSRLFAGLNMGADGSDITSVSPEIVTQLDEKLGTNIAGYISACLMSFVSIIPICILAMGIRIITYVIAFTRIIELNVRACFLPIASALMSDDGWRGTGGRYIRKFVAICCQSAVLVCVAKIGTYAFSILSKNIIENLAGTISGTGNPIMAMGGDLVILCGLGVAMVSVMMKSIGIVNDAFGG